MIEIKKAKKLQVSSHNRERNFSNVWKKITERDICNKKIFLEFSISHIITFCVTCFVSIYDCVKDKNWIDKMTEIVLKKDIILLHQKVLGIVGNCGILSVGFWLLSWYSSHKCYENVEICFHAIKFLK